MWEEVTTTPPGLTMSDLCADDDYTCSTWELVVDNSEMSHKEALRIAAVKLLL